MLRRGDNIRRGADVLEFVSVVGDKLPKHATDEETLRVLVSNTIHGERYAGVIVVVREGHLGVVEEVPCKH